jgi:hypothetical protein
MTCLNKLYLKISTNTRKKSENNNLACTHPEAEASGKICI